MTQSRVKLYKNPQRADAAAHKPYVPQYQVLGVEPEQIKSHVVPEGTLVAKSNQDNPRTKSIGLRQPYGHPTPSPIGVGKGPMPNVGNNRDHTWSGVDEIIDDLEEVNLQATMIDNNDYVTDSALGIDKSSIPQTKVKDKKSFSEEDLLSTLHNLPEQSYLLIVNDVVICSGDLKKVEEEAKDLVFGDHPLCDGEPIPVENLFIVKKVSIKIGVFLE
jgi:hypothetical protein